MPGNQDNNSMDNMSMDDINELYEDVVETPDEYKFLALGQGIDSPPIWGGKSHDAARFC